MPDVSARRPTPKEAKALKAASVHEDGHLPRDTSPRHIESMLVAEWIYGQDADGFRLEPEDALNEISTALFRILPAGRRAPLSRTQWRALTQVRDASGRLSVGATTQTNRCLAALGLVEYRNDKGELSPGGSSAGFHPHRSALGEQVVAEAGAS